MIKINGITKRYDKGSNPAVDNLSLEVKHGEIFGFIGPNGAGKTTTINMITGVFPPDSGNISIDGVDIVQNPIEAKMKMGFVPDSHDIYDSLKGYEYIDFIAAVYNTPKEQKEARTRKYLEMFELTNAANDTIKSYSHGMRQKIIITAALVHNPKLWILDEPMVGLDPRSAHLLKEEMRNHTSHGNTVFFSTHVLEVAEALCDRIAIINGGKIIAVGTIDELRQSTDQSLEELFLTLTDKEGF